jgi:hypothetical protein
MARESSEEALIEKAQENVARLLPAARDLVTQLGSCSGQRGWTTPAPAHCRPSGLRRRKKDHDRRLKTRENHRTHALPRTEPSKLVVFTHTAF